MPPYIYLIIFFAGLAWTMLPFTQKEFYKQLNKFIIYLPLPMMTLTKIPDLDVMNNLSETLPPILAVWLQLLLSLAFMTSIGKVLKWDRTTTGCMALVCGLGNTSFIGFPLVATYFGAENIKYALIIDQGGSFLCLSIGGVIIATAFSSGKIKVTEMVKNLITFPPFLMFMFSIVNPSDILHNEWYLDKLYPIFSFLGSLMVPLAILSIGMQFKFSFEGVNKKAFGIGLFYKLLLFPTIAYLILHIIMGRTDIMYDVTVFELAMPPMITASILALNYDLKPKLANALVTLGILVALPILHMWYMVLT